MKYLKTYENDFETLQFKKYIVYVNKIQNNPPLSLAILKVLEVNNTPGHRDIKTERLLLYDFTINQEIDITDENNIDENLILLIIKRIEFQSDNYQDCLDYLEMLKNTSKYNL